MDAYELTTYVPHVGEVFRLEFTEGPSVELTLVDAAPGPWQRADGGRVAFRLEFSGPGEPLLAQGTYRMEHAALGAVGLFIVPLAQDEKSTAYEAVVN